MTLSFNRNILLGPCRAHAAVPDSHFDRGLGEGYSCIANRRPSMILNDVALRQRAIDGLVSPLTLSNVQGSSIDLTLGTTIKVEAPVGTGGDWFEVDLSEQGYALDPGEFILAHTAETITIPDDCSAMVRFAVQQHARAMSTAWPDGATQASQGKSPWSYATTCASVICL